MTYNTPQSLLALPPNVKAPDAYRVLGLPSLEADRARIKAAIEAKLVRLADTKSQADPAAWAQASQWVKNAQAILSDASKKAAYDRKLAAENPGASAPVVDPLAGMLPTPARKPAAPASDPMADFLPQGPPSLRTARMGQAESMVAVEEAPSEAPVAVPMVRRRPVSTKRRMPWVPIILTVFCLAAIGGLGGLAYLMLQGKGGTIVINPNGGTVLASGEGGARMISAPGAVPDRQKQPYDPVMGGLAGKVPPPRSEQGLAPEQVAPPKTPSNPPMTEDMDSQPMESEPMDMQPGEPGPMEPVTPAPNPNMVPEPMVPETPEPAPTEPIPAEPPMPEPTPEEIQAGVVALTAVGTAIKQHDWANMKRLAEAAEAVAAGPQQKLLAGDLFQFVDLVSYYHGAIEKSLKTLGSGVELDLSNQVKVIVVEATPAKLIIRVNGNNREYETAKLPLGIANKLAEMSLAADPATLQAAKLSYQAMSPVTTPEIRLAAVNELEKITDEVEGAEPAKLVSVIRFLYQM
jgi:hypothetical protein